MTEIRSIHGVPGNEMRDRGRLVSAKAPYIPYTALTKGEFDLSLLFDEADVFAAAYPDFPVYRQVKTMYQNALQQGISGGVQFVGALYDPMLQQAAQNIALAAKKTAPAAKVITGRESLLSGIHIGDNTTYTGIFDHDCVQYARKNANAHFNLNRDWQYWEALPTVGPFADKKRYFVEQKNNCKIRVAIEQIMNNNMVDTSHHLLYKSLSTAFPDTLGTLVLAKKTLHLIGIAGLGQVSEIDPTRMGTWAEACVIRKNTSTGAGAFGSVDSSLSISPDPEGMVAKYNRFLAANPSQDPKKIKMGIGVAPAAAAATVGVVTEIAAVVTAIGGAIAAAAAFARELRSKRDGALATAQGFGSEAYGGDKDDFLTPVPDNSKMLLLGGAALAAYFLLDEK